RTGGFSSTPNWIAPTPPSRCCRTGILTRRSNAHAADHSFVVVSFSDHRLVGRRSGAMIELVVGVRRHDGRRRWRHSYFDTDVDQTLIKRGLPALAPILSRR